MRFPVWPAGSDVNYLGGRFGLPEVKVVHESTDRDEQAVLATDVAVADSLWRKGIGLMFKRSLPEDFALVFPFSRVKTRDIHMVCVFVPLDVLWIVDDEVRRVERLRPWRGYAREPADLVIELPAGAGSDVAAGDTVRVEGP